MNYGYGMLTILHKSVRLWKSQQTEECNLHNVYLFFASLSLFLSPHNLAPFPILYLFAQKMYVV